MPFVSPASASPCRGLRPGPPYAMACGRPHACRVLPRLARPSYSLPSRAVLRATGCPARPRLSVPSLFFCRVRSRAGGAFPSRRRSSARPSPPGLSSRLAPRLALLAFDRPRLSRPGWDASPNAPTPRAAGGSCTRTTGGRKRQAGGKKTSGGKEDNNRTKPMQRQTTPGRGPGRSGRGKGPCAYRVLRRFAPPPFRLRRGLGPAGPRRVARGLGDSQRRAEETPSASLHPSHRPIPAF